MFITTLPLITLLLLLILGHTVFLPHFLSAFPSFCSVNRHCVSLQDERERARDRGGERNMDSSETAAESDQSQEGNPPAHMAYS